MDKSCQSADCSFNNKAGAPDENRRELLPSPTDNPHRGCSPGTADNKESFMVKSELIQQIASRQHGLSLEDVELSINQILDYMSDMLSKGTRIEIRGFGSFSLHYRPPRNAHNPKTGEKLETVAKYWPHFKCGKELRVRLNAKMAEGLGVQQA